MIEKKFFNQKMSFNNRLFIAGLICTSISTSLSGSPTKADEEQGWYLTLGGGLAAIQDTEWKWGNYPMSIYTVVTNGSPDKKSGMQAWVNELGPQKVSQVVAFVLSHHNEQDMASATSENDPIGL